MRPILIFVVLAFASVSVACDEGYPTPEPTQPTSVQVTLPTKPSLAKRPYARTHPDGSLTVEALMRERRVYMDQAVKVRGVVKKLVQCAAPPAPAYIPPTPDPRAVRRGEVPAEPTPPPAPKPPRTCDPPPHAYIVDQDPVSKRELLVYGSMFSPLADFQMGDTVVVEGKFGIVSTDGVYLRQAGLVELADTPEPEPEPVPAPEEDK